MKKELDITHTDMNNGDAVIEHGYEIYDEWESRRLPSRRIVSYVEHVVSAMKRNKTYAASIEALACLFALDLRIKEKYGTLLQYLFSYFACKRETRAFDLLKSSLRIPKDEKDIRTAIEVKLQKLRERIEAKEEEDEDEDGTRGGKRAGKSEEEAAAEKAGQEEEAEATQEESADVEEAEETAEEITEEEPENAISEEAKEERQTSEEAQEATDEPVAQEEQKEPLEEKLKEDKQENDSSDTAEEELTEDKKEEAKTYNDAIDLPLPLYEERESQKTTDTKRSLIDEVIMDNMIKRKDDVLGRKLMEYPSQAGDEGKKAEDSALRQNGELGDKDGQNSEKDAYLYDKMMLGNQGRETGGRSADDKLAQTATNEQTKTNEQASTNEAEEIDADNELADDGILKPDEEKTRVPLQVDINASQENDMRKEINDNLMLSKESIEAIKNAGSEAMSRMLDVAEADAIKERMNLAGEDLGSDLPAKSIDRPEPSQAKQPGVGLNRK